MPIPGTRMDVIAPSLDESTVSQTLSIDCRVALALEEYAALLRDGKQPQRAEFLKQHASIAGNLETCIAGLELVQELARDLKPESDPASIFSTSAASTLGDFHLIREIGRGGMGVVYEALQLTLGRRVALKVLPTAASLDSRQLQRFQVEAQAAALLHHEHIVPIFAIGQDRGVHYYAMQLIEGQMLADVIHGMKAEGSTREPLIPAQAGDPHRREPSRELPAAFRLSGHSTSARNRARELARLILQAAEAIEHAHDLGVIHRDIKPSNLLLDQKGKLWVADFGLARVPHEEHDLTHTGDLIGTLRYMSPEQVSAQRGQVTAATDIYSLGATLFELLTLRPAFDSADRLDLLRSILHDEPVWPRKLNPAIPHELEAIVLKAMEKEPSARYATVRDLSQDLRRFLDDKPVLARRPGLLDRSVKWARRHRTAVVAATSALIVTLTATILMLWHANRLTEATLANYKLALNVQRQGVEYALGALDQITRPRVSATGSTPPNEETASILRWAISYYDRIPGLLGDVDMIREPVATAHRQAGFCRMALRDAQGHKDYRVAIDLYEQLAARNPERIWLRTELIETLHEYSRLLTAEADRPESEACFQRAFEVAESLIGNATAALPCYSERLVGPLTELSRELSSRSTDPASIARAERLARQAREWNSALRQARDARETGGPATSPSR